MAAARNNLTRRAVLGAAAMLPMMPAGAEAMGPLHQPSAGPPPRPGEDNWRRLLAAYRSAAAEVRAFERETAGAPWTEQGWIEERHGALSDATYVALRQLLRTPAQNIAALAAKIDLIIEHEVGTLTGGEACLAALRRDARRLAAQGSAA